MQKYIALNTSLQNCKTCSFRGGVSIYVIIFVMKDFAPGRSLW